MFLVVFHVEGFIVRKERWWSEVFLSWCRAIVEGDIYGSDKILVIKDMR